MSEFFSESSFFALFISLLGYEIGVFLRKKTGVAIFNPLLIAIAFVIGLLLLIGMDYETYKSGSSLLSYFLTPSTVALAVPLYRQFAVLKKHALAILTGILSGVLTSLATTLLLAVLCRLNHSEYVTLLPKSVTTAIGMSISEELGGIVTITVASIVLTGIFGNMAGDFICRVFHIKEKVAVGLAMGTSSHSIGTARAMEMGDLEGAMGSLAIVVAGLFTVIGANIFAMFF